MKRILIVIQLEAGSTLGRIAQDMPKIITMLSRFAKEPPLPAFRSSDGIHSGFLIECDRPVAMIRAEFVGCDGTSNNDHCLVMELGDEIDGTIGMSRALTWAQHRKPL